MASAQQNVLITFNTVAQKQGISQLKSATDDYFRTLRNISGVTAIVLGSLTREFGRLAQSIVMTAAKFEQFQIKLFAVTKNMEQSKAILKNMADMAATTPFKVEDLTDAATTLKIYNQELEKAMPLVAGLAGAMNRDIRDAALAFGRAAKGSSYGFRQLRESFGVTTDELDKFGAITHKNKLQLHGVAGGVEAAKRALYRLVESKYGNMLALQMNTASTAISNVSDALINLANDIGQAILPIIQPAIQAVIDLINGFRNFLDIFPILKTLIGMLIIITPLVTGLGTVMATLTFGISGTILLWNQLTKAIQANSMAKSENIGVTNSLASANAVESASLSSSAIAHSVSGGIGAIASGGIAPSAITSSMPATPGGFLPITKTLEPVVNSVPAIETVDRKMESIAVSTGIIADKVRVFNSKDIKEFDKALDIGVAIPEIKRGKSGEIIKNLKAEEEYLKKFREGTDSAVDGIQVLNTSLEKTDRIASNIELPVMSSKSGIGMVDEQRARMLRNSSLRESKTSLGEFTAEQKAKYEAEIALENNLYKQKSEARRKNRKQSLNEEIEYFEKITKEQTKLEKEAMEKSLAFHSQVIQERQKSSNVPDLVASTGLLKEGLEIEKDRYKISTDFSELSKVTLKDKEEALKVEASIIEQIAAGEELRQARRIANAGKMKTIAEPFDKLKKDLGTIDGALDNIEDGLKNRIAPPMEWWQTSVAKSAFLWGGIALGIAAVAGTIYLINQAINEPFEKWKKLNKSISEQNDLIDKSIDKTNKMAVVLNRVNEKGIGFAEAIKQINQEVTDKVGQGNIVGFIDIEDEIWEKRLALEAKLKSMEEIKLKFGYDSEAFKMTIDSLKQQLADEEFNIKVEMKTQNLESAKKIAKRDLTELDAVRQEMIDYTTKRGLDGIVGGNFKEFEKIYKDKMKEISHYADGGITSIKIGNKEYAIQKQELEKIYELKQQEYTLSQLILADKMKMSQLEKSLKGDKDIQQGKINTKIQAEEKIGIAKQATTTEESRYSLIMEQARMIRESGQAGWQEKYNEKVKEGNKVLDGLIRSQKYLVEIMGQVPEAISKEMQLEASINNENKKIIEHKLQILENSKGITKETLKTQIIETENATKTSKNKLEALQKQLATFKGIYNFIVEKEKIEKQSVVSTEFKNELSSKIASTEKDITAQKEKQAKKIEKANKRLLEQKEMLDKLNLATKKGFKSATKKAEGELFSDVQSTASSQADDIKKILYYKEILKGEGNLNILIEERKKTLKEEYDMRLEELAVKKNDFDNEKDYLSAVKEVNNEYQKSLKSLQLSDDAHKKINAEIDKTIVKQREAFKEFRIGIKEEIVESGLGSDLEKKIFKIKAKEAKDIKEKVIDIEKVDPEQAGRNKTAIEARTANDIKKIHDQFLKDYYETEEKKIESLKKNLESLKEKRLGGANSPLIGLEELGTQSAFFFASSSKPNKSKAEEAFDKAKSNVDQSITIENITITDESDKKVLRAILFSSLRTAKEALREDNYNSNIGETNTGNQWSE